MTTNTLSSNSPDELIRIFQDAPGTTGGAPKNSNRFKRMYYGAGENEDLVIGNYQNGDLTLKYIGLMMEAVTTEILSLTITDSRAGFSAGEKITEKSDLIHRLRVMGQQRNSIKTKKNYISVSSDISLGELKKLVQERSLEAGTVFDVLEKGEKKEFLVYDPYESFQFRRARNKDALLSILHEIKVKKERWPTKKAA